MGLKRAWVAGLVLVGLLAFVGISTILARAFSIDGAERVAITNLIEVEARGDAAALVRQIDGCAKSPACRRRAAVDARYLRRPGKVLILELNPSAGFSLGSTIGTARVAWRAGTALPIVQCVRVRRAGDVFSGLRVQLLELSVRIKTDADCPRVY